MPLSRSRLCSLLLLSFFFSSNAFASESADTYGELILYIMPSNPVKMDWNSPRDLLLSTVSAALFNGELTLGHVSVEVSCGLSDRENLPIKKDPSSYVLSSAVPAAGDPSVDLLLKKKIGFSLQESGWKGAVETPEQVKNSFKIVKSDPKKVSSMKFLISDASCRRLTTFFREYSAMAPNLYYGNSPRPRRKEGSGCSAFGVAFLQLAGLMNEEFRKDWSVTVRVPLTLMAGYAGKKKVSVWDVITSPDSREWAREWEPHMNIETYEPALMHKWIVNLVNSPQALRALGGELDTKLSHGLRGISAIRFDRRSVPTPSEPIFTGPPALKKTSAVTVIRADKVYSGNGSFELRP